MKLFQYFQILMIVVVTLLGCRLTGYAEEEEQLTEDLCLYSSSVYLQRKEGGYSYPYREDYDLLAIVYSCIVRPDEIDARGY